MPLIYGPGTAQGASMQRTDFIARRDLIERPHIDKRIDELASEKKQVDAQVRTNAQHEINNDDAESLAGVARRETDHDRAIANAAAVNRPHETYGPRPESERATLGMLVDRFA